MSKATNVDVNNELPIEALILQNTKDKYKLSYSAIRWAKEIKQKENLPDPIPTLVPRAIREILTGKISLKEIEKLPYMAKLATPVVTAAPPAPPKLTLNVNTEAEAEEEKAVPEAKASKEVPAEEPEEDAEKESEDEEAAADEK